MSTEPTPEEPLRLRAFPYALGCVSMLMLWAFVAWGVLMSLPLFASLFVGGADSWNLTLPPNEFGDSFGGVTALATVLALFAALVSMSLQSRELWYTRREMVEQRGEVRQQQLSTKAAALIALAEQLLNSAELDADGIRDSLDGLDGMSKMTPGSDTFYSGTVPGRLKNAFEAAERRNKFLVVRQRALAEAMKVIGHLDGVELTETLPPVPDYDWEGHRQMLATLTDLVRTSGRSVETELAKLDEGDDHPPELKAALEDFWRLKLAVERVLRAMSKYSEPLVMGGMAEPEVGAGSGHHGTTSTV